MDKSNQIKKDLRKSESEFNIKRSNVKKYTNSMSILSVENRELTVSIKNYKNNEI